jgi:3-deoxy-D-manno-octulosonic-acid transferase
LAILPRPFEGLALRYLYTLVMYLATPLIVLRLLTRGMRYGNYHRRWPERFGAFDAPADMAGCLWVHAVSVGEVNAAEPLIKALRADYPNAPLAVTTVTPTGSARVHQLFGDEVFHVYLPYDLPFAVKRFLQRLRPRLALIVETEIWPNLYLACRRRGIPLMIVNARLSERSLRGYRPLKPVLRSALRGVRVAAQSHTDAARYRLLGADPELITVSGNLKFDMPLPCGAVPAGEALREAWGRLRPVWIAASTHEGEEQAALEAHLQVLERLPDALLLIAARHPERFRLVEYAVRNLGFSMATRSADRVPGAAHQVFVVDSMGELMPFYAASDVAFVGGSLAPIGGHNVLEPAALSRPVLVGPNTFNFEEITLTLIREGGGERVADGAELGPKVLALLCDRERREHMGRCARRVFDSERGAVRRVMRLVDGMLQE